MRGHSLCFSAEWEAIVKIAFVDEKKLLDAMQSCDANLTNEERERQRFLPPKVCFRHSGNAILRSQLSCP